MYVWHELPFSQDPKSRCVTSMWSLLHSRGQGNQPFFQCIVLHPFTGVLKPTGLRVPHARDMRSAPSIAGSHHVNSSSHKYRSLFHTYHRLFPGLCNTSTPFLFEEGIIPGLIRSPAELDGQPSIALILHAPILEPPSRLAKIYPRQ